jgi:hypothetical protein
MRRTAGGPPVVGRIVGGMFVASWLARLGLEVADKRRKPGFAPRDAALLAGMALTALAPALAHRNRFFGRLPHHPAQLVLVSAGVAANWTSLAYLAAGKQTIGPCDADLVYRSGTALMLESPFVFLVLVLPGMALDWLGRRPHQD